MVLEEITYTNFLGLSLVAWLGIVTYLCVIFTALIPMLRKKFKKLSLKLHVRMGIISIVLATIHGTLIVLTNF